MEELGLYLDEKLRRQIADDIRHLELPSEWRPFEVIRYIVRIIEKNNG
jgi:hypothetical protein